MRAYTALALACTMACGGSSREPQPPIFPSQTPDKSVTPEKTAPPVRDAVIEGDVVDSLTKQKLPGATVVAASDVAEDVVITDESGHFRIAVSARPHEITVYYADVHVSRRVVVQRDAIAPLVIEIDHRAIVVADHVSRGTNAECPPMSNAAVTQADVTPVVRAVLERALSNDSAIAGNPAPHRGVTYVAQEIGTSTFRVEPAALPPKPRDAYMLRPMPQLQAEADRLHADLEFVSFVSVGINGDCARVHVGPQVVGPSAGSGACCCSTVDLYERIAGRWRFRVNVGGTCP